MGERATAWIGVPFFAPNLQTARMALSALGEEIPQFVRDKFSNVP
jgi:hypothetical protein